MTPEAQALFDWLVDGAPGAVGSVALLDHLCPRLCDAGVPVERVAAFERTLHPELMGRAFEWRRGEATVVREATYAVLHTPTFLASPIARVFETGAPLRIVLGDAAEQARFQVVRDLAAEGMTDYVALPLRFVSGEIHGVTFATKASGGFSGAHLEILHHIARPLARLAEIHALGRTAVNLLDTYVGRSAGERILGGKILRGDTETIRCVLWFSDLRGFTSLSGSVTPNVLIRTLNEVFDCQVPSITKRGGEVLKFIGDGMLAIFPVGGEGEGEVGRVARLALEAADEAFAKLAALNDARSARGDAPVRFGVALHLGEVSYGNIGGAGRLDFTCIGPAVNLAARLEGLASKLGLPLVISEEVAAHVERPLRDLGAHDLKGIDGARRAFAPA